MAAKRKKKNNLSTAIIVLNLLIAGIIIMLIVLIYMHFANGGESEQTESTTPAVTEEEITTTTTEATTTTAASMTKVSTDPIEPVPFETSDNTTVDVTYVPATYNKEFFANDLFIGDSISTGLVGYGYLNSANVFAQVGLNPDSAITKEIEGETAVSRVASMQPDRVYLMLGSNGLAYMGNDYMANKMLELISEIEIACPTADIVIISIPPVTAAHEAEGNETMALVNDYNAKLKNIASNGGYLYVDLCSRLVDGTGYFSSAYAEQDGLHFLGTAYIEMLSYIEQCVNA